MPKSKKKKNRDFQKVRLKVGKEKRSGTDVSLSFKTRAIKVPQTFRDFSNNSEQPQTKKKLTFEDLLKQCDGNKSRSQRLSAVEGLRELALSNEGSTAHSSFWSSKFWSLMTRLACLFSDPEPPVRQGVLRLCKTVFPMVSEQTISLNYFSAQLCCAMSHVSDDIRHDALVLFDMVLDKCPEKLIDEYCRLVPALIDQICSYMLTDKTAHRTLAVNPRSKLSSQKWRTEVLLRLAKIVDIYVNKHRKDAATPSACEHEVYHFGTDYPMIREPCVPPSWKKKWTTWPKARLQGMNRQEYSSMARDPKQLQKFISSVLPVVKQCWAEEFASDDRAGTFHTPADVGRPLTQDSLPMLQAVVGVVHSFVECWRCTFIYSNKTYDKNCWFRSEFLHELQEMLLPHFPIVLTEKLVKGKKGQQAGQASGSSDSVDTSSLQISVLKLNLEVSEILASFPPLEEGRRRVGDNLEDWQKQVVMFLLKNLKRCTGADLSTRVTKVLHQVFFHCPFTTKLGRLLTKTQKRFIKAHPLSTEKRVFLDLLDELAFDGNCDSPYHPARACDGGRHELLESYLQALPRVLLELCEVDATEQITCRVTKAMCYNSSKLLTDAMLLHMPQLLDAETGVFAKLPKSCHENMLLAVMWAYNAIPIPEPILEQMELIIRHPHVEKEICGRLVMNVNVSFRELMDKARRQNLSIRQELEDSKKDYIRFLLSVLVGHKKVELEAVDKANKPETEGLTQVVWTCTMEHFAKHQHVVMKSCQYFCTYLKTTISDMSMYGVYAMDVMAEIWSVKILREYSSLSVLTVCGALMHWLFMMAPLKKGEALHVDVAPCPSQYAQPDLWQSHVDQMLPVFKAHLRPFTRLAFSLMYSMVALETAGEEVVLPPTGMMEEMWKVVVSLMESSFRMMVDLLQVITEFVQEKQMEQESMRTTVLLTKLMAAKELQNHMIIYHHLLSPQLACFVATVKTATPQVETYQWWLDFIYKHV